MSQEEKGKDIVSPNDAVRHVLLTWGDLHLPIGTPSQAAASRPDVT